MVVSAFKGRPSGWSSGSEDRADQRRVNDNMDDDEGLRCSAEGAVDPEFIASCIMLRYGKLVFASFTNGVSVALH